jgi:hypothetical protein
MDSRVRLYHETHKPKGDFYSPEDAKRLLAQPANKEGHKWSKIKTKKRNEITDNRNIERDLAASEGNANTVMYHAKEAPKGQTFQPGQLSALNDEWVDTPAKFGKAAAEVEEKLESPKIPTEEEIRAASDLLGGEGLNHSAWMRSLGLEPKRARKKTKVIYDAILSSFGNDIKHQDKDWFWK